MSEQEDIDALAGEYVLGTLDAGERASVAARRQREPALEAAIVAWERRLGPLADAVADVAPPPSLLEQINARLVAGTPPPLRGRWPEGPEGGGPNIVQLQRRVTTWRRAAIAASGLAACLALAIGIRESTRQPDVGHLAVFVQDDIAPSFVLAVDFATRTLSVKAVGAKPLPDKAYQLWIVHDRLGPAPQSLGLITLDAAGLSRRPVEFDRALLTTATFGVSIEPPGGSPTGRPTGPALHAKLMPAAL